jgi:hypothetical protein
MKRGEKGKASVPMNIFWDHHQRNPLYDQNAAQGRDPDGERNRQA